MGIAVSDDGNQIAIASKSEIGIFGSNSALANSFPEKTNHYSHLYIPQCKFNTGIVDTHEITWTDQGLLFTNTLFSCLSRMSYHYHFEEAWRPSFISELAPEDRCHLNGIALRDGKPKYATMFAKTDENKGWRKLPFDSGLLMDIESGEILLDKLALPHSPVYFDNKIYFLQSATGDVMYYDLKTKQAVKLNNFKSFVRGMEVLDKYIFLGMSKIRPDSQFFSELPVTAEESTCAIRVLNRETGKEVAGLTYTDKIEEIFAVKIARGVKCPGLLTERDELYDKCLSIPDGQNYWLKNILIEKPITN